MAKPGGLQSRENCGRAFSRKGRIFGQGTFSGSGDVNNRSKIIEKVWSLEHSRQTKIIIVSNGVELFEKIIRFWRSRSDSTEALTPQEIAFHVLGKGSSDNARKILLTLNQFKQCFYPPSTYGKKWRVNWTKVKTEHPSLFNLSPAPASPLDGMMQVLDDEIRAVKKDMEEHPVWAQISNELRRDR